MPDVNRFSGPNAGYIAELYERYLIDPASVDADLRAYFDSLARQPDSLDQALSGGEAVALPRIRAALRLVDAVRTQGHFAASLDPLGLRKPVTGASDLSTFGVSLEELARLPAALVDSPASAGTLNAADAIDRLRAVYCGTSGYEFSHITVPDERTWLRNSVESGEHGASLDAGASQNLLMLLTRVEAFERFLGRSFPGQKWFSIEGTDMLVPMLEEIIRRASSSTLRHIVLGMAHRGRLNILAHTMHRPYDSILADFMEGYFERESESSDWGWMRDVKYHMGAVSSRPSATGRDLSLSLLANPSHVELVDPVVAGAVRALQEGGANGSGAPAAEAAMGILMHGDAAFAGQGIVAETLNLSQLRGYGTGGTLHIVVNNQIGFTTEPAEAQSTTYATDLARGFGVPVVHVNGDDPVACLSAARLAYAYRSRFKKDFVIDLIGYRRLGHNEGDEPSYTQPRMYQVIENHPTVREIWARRLVSEGIVSADDVEEMEREALGRLQAAKEAITLSEGIPPLERGPDGDAGAGHGLDASTAVPVDRLLVLNRELHHAPAGFTLHPKLERPLQRRLESLESGGAIDWAHAESLAFASILADGIPVRITGQDTERGTFSQRHAALHDAETGEKYVSLAVLPSARATFAIYNSPLSEMGVLAYEYGFSVKSPKTLVLWEAQFGDFINNAQSVIDELIVSARAKWAQDSGLVLLLPHGYEGQGPNHSSAHLERFLHLAAGDNIQVASCTTAGQYFHLLRRQAARLAQRPRPLVVMTAKSLLRHPKAASTLADLTQGAFRPVIDDFEAAKAPGQVRRLIFCTGKVFVDLVSSDEYAGAKRVAAVRIEELYPFPVNEVAEILDRYDRIEDVVWLQEEPQNRGAWFFAGPRLHALLKPGIPLVYAGRPDRPSAAPGSHHVHKLQQAQLIRQAVLERPGKPTKGQKVANVS